ncbi:MAG TPA: undecaprenyl-diphosphate phosphatase [Caulobacteraceae bacterium]|jgi:undecaprenyl-diphosphatase|nr:undecaprenyl-diphosphate phosphatase [Caulobacteraceae bacterium]
MSGLQAIILAIVQGITELFPISSLGHAVVMPALLGWRIDENSEGFLPFLVVMHLGTALALLVYFWRDWLEFAMAVLVRRGPRAAAERRLFWKIVVATLPAMVIGFVLEKHLKHIFGAPVIAAGFLVVNGVMLFVAERWKGRGERKLEHLRWFDALAIGLWQCLALIPGLSRSGATMAGGYLAGLDHEDAARFSFWTATPIILGAGVLEAPKLLHHGAGGGFSGVAIMAGAVAGVVAFISVAVLMRWFRDHEARGFDPFAIYCWVAGAGSVAWLMLRH